MKFKILLVLSLVFLLASCGGTKKARKIKKNPRKTTASTTRTQPRLGKDVPSIEDLPNPLNQHTPHFESDVSRYIYQYKAVAKEEMGTYGIPASITLAQGILESGSGRSELTRKSNNHFGIKCHDWTGDRVYHDDDMAQECFRKYDNPNYSFRDHSLFLKNRPRYGRLFNLSIDDYKGWARGLKAAGYATDPSYPKKLIGIIERYELHKFDQEVLKKITTKPSAPKKEEKKKPSASQKTYVVKKGDTLYSISKRFGMSVDRLQKRNNLVDNTISIGQELVVD